MRQDELAPFLTDLPCELVYPLMNEHDRNDAVFSGGLPLAPDDGLSGFVLPSEPVRDEGDEDARVLYRVETRIVGADAVRNGKFGIITFSNDDPSLP